MPLLNEIVKDRDTKKFVKRSYRPWDLSGTDPHHKTNEQIIQPHGNNEEQVTNPLQNSHYLESKIENGNLESYTYIDNNKITITQQLDNNEATHRQQLDNIQETIQITNREQIDNNLDEINIYNDVLRLTGLQKKIVDCVVDICISINKLETGPIETNRLCLYVNSSRESIKTSINRLINKGLIIRNKGKTARGGYINLSITKDILSTIMTLREKNKYNNDSINMADLIRKQLGNIPIYSSNSNKLNTTTKETIPSEWDDIEFSPLLEIGFNKTQIKQLIGKNDPAIVQESIYHFAYGLKHNQKFSKYEEPLNVIMGVLRKGQGWCEKNYRSEQELAQQKFIENKKAELQRKKILEEEAYKLAFTEWQLQLKPEELEKIAPSYKNGGDITPQPAKLSIFFKENIWISKKGEYLISD